MPHDKNTPAENSAAKKAAVLGTERRKKSWTAVVVMTACAALVIGGGVFFLSKEPQPASARAPAASTSANAAAEVVLPVSTFEGGKAQYFEHRTEGGITVRYFVLRSSDGVIRAAFDACDACWRAGRGYFQEGDEMVCRNCRMRFASVKINEVKGGCNPAPLRREVRGDQVVLRVADIEAGRSYFDLGREG